MKGFKFAAHPHSGNQKIEGANESEFYVKLKDVDSNREYGLLDLKTRVIVKVRCSFSNEGAEHKF